MDEDLDTPKAIAVMFDAVKQAHKHQDVADREAQIAKEYSRAVFDIAKALGLALKSDPTVLDQATQMLIKARDEARLAKDFETSDNLRRELAYLGWAVEDTPEGTKVHRFKL